MKNNLMWYRKPASKWEEALPVGNGRMGAMIYGIPDHELIQLNEDSIWYGRKMDRINPDARDNLEKVRRLILDNKIKEAEELLKYSFSATPKSMTPYQPLGVLHLDMRTEGVLSQERFKPDKYCHIDIPEKAVEKEMPVTGYRRNLSLSDAVYYMEYTQAGVTYQRETIASFPAQVIATHITASKKGALSFSCLLERNPFLDWSGKAGERTIMIKGSGGEGGILFCGAVRVAAEGGSVQVLGEHIIVDNADSATIYIASETSFYHGDHYAEKAMERLDRAEKDGYEKIREEHIRDYQNLYNRMEINLGQEDYEAETVEERIQNLSKRKKDNGLVIMQFNFGRYLLISSSRPGSLPANLQGIWNDKMNPKWDSKFTININTEMNYWGAECANLSECHLPLFDLLRKVQKNGRDVAERMYGCRGFVAHHNTNGWGDCAPQDIWIPATYWVLGGAWLSIHIWKHYSYTLDKTWLADMYDVLRDAVLFVSDYLIEVDGQLLTCPSVSPENTYIMEDGTQGRVTAGPTMDNSLIRELIHGYLEASKVLGIRDEVVEAAEKIPERLPPLKIGKYGQIMEWREDYDEIEPGHRHISQLYALYPGHEITVDGTPELARAAETTIRRRLQYGGGHTGWSCAWIAGFFASLWKGNEANEYQIKLLTNSSYMNLMTNHPLNPSGSVFQIDANLGTVSNVIHMLVQAHEKKIHLLPALPDAWSEGWVRGICVPGDAEISMKWKNGVLVKAEITARHGGDYEICCGKRTWQIKISDGEKRTLEW